jgi:hypothetical protein
LAKFLYNEGGLKEFNVSSFWGAIASFSLLQMLSIIFYQAFLFYLSNPKFGAMHFFLLVFILFQSSAIGRIQEFLKNNGYAYAITDLKNFKEKMKLILAILSLLIFVYLIFFNYPFPKHESKWVYYVIFYLGCLVISYWTLKTINTTSFKVANGFGRWFGLLMGLLFFYTGTLSAAVFYFHGIIGISISVLMLSAWLVEKDQA